MHIYIHIPFCESKCPYCAFGSHSDQFDKTKRYFQALNTQIESLKFDRQISTIFIGGGTPSSVDAGFYTQMFEYFKPHLSPNCEITSEANPNSANKKWLENMVKNGINRLSLGAQSFDKNKLKLLGRIHNAKRIFQAVDDAKSAGIDNINVDIIYGTKLDTKSLLKSEVEAIKMLDISHLSAYSLTLESDTPFANKHSYQKDSPTLAKYLIKSIENIGLKQYEISNFGLPCKHNQAYWSGADYYGFGAYAVSTIGLKRQTGNSNLDEYILDPFSHQSEILTAKDRQNERIFLGLRSSLGVAFSDLDTTMQTKAQILIDENKLISNGSRVYNPNFLLSDEIYLYLSS